MYVTLNYVRNTCSCRAPILLFHLFFTLELNRIHRIKSLHKDARNALLFWHDRGKPRNGNIFETMNEIRKEFEQGLKLCKKTELQI